MMVQGHTIDSTLAPAYRDADSILYTLWSYLRGMTAPLFMFISGYLVLHLLTNTTQPLHRVKKILNRGLLLIVLAYLLRINYGAIFSFGDLSNAGFRYFLSLHILHVIGFAVILLSLIIHFTKNILSKQGMGGILLSLALLSFYAEYFLQHTSIFDSLPLAVWNWLYKSEGSVFVLFPWIGYAFFGAGVSALFHESLIENPIRKGIIGGLILLIISYSFSAWPIDYLSTYGWRYIWLAWAILLVSLFSYLSKAKAMPKHVYSIGQRTLAIFIIHELILFGAVSGIGIAKVYHESLNWYGSIILALIILLVSILLAHLYYKLISIRRGINQS